MFQPKNPVTLSLRSRFPGIFKGYRRRNFYLRPSESPEQNVSPDSQRVVGTHNSRSCFKVFNLGTHESFTPPSSDRYTLQFGEVLIETGTFMGREATMRITFLKEDAALIEKLFFPAPSTTPKKDEKTAASDFLARINKKLATIP